MSIRTWSVRRIGSGKKIKWREIQAASAKSAAIKFARKAKLDRRDVIVRIDGKDLRFHMRNEHTYVLRAYEVKY